jgi:hypothetical protein
MGLLKVDILLSELNPDPENQKAMQSLSDRPFAAYPSLPLKVL